MNTPKSVLNFIIWVHPEGGDAEHGWYLGSPTKEGEQALLFDTLEEAVVAIRDPRVSDGKYSIESHDSTDIHEEDVNIEGLFSIMKVHGALIIL